VFSLGRDRSLFSDLARFRSRGPCESSQPSPLPLFSRPQGFSNAPPFKRPTLFSVQRNKTLIKKYKKRGAGQKWFRLLVFGRATPSLRHPFKLFSLARIHVGRVRPPKRPKAPQNFALAFTINYFFFHLLRKPKIQTFKFFPNASALGNATTNFWAALRDPQNPRC